MMRKLVYIIKLLILFSTGIVNAQEDSTGVFNDAVMIIDDTPTTFVDDSTVVLEKSFAIEISADYGKGIESLVSKQKKWEFGIGAVINDRFAFVGELGYGHLFPESVIQNGTYEVEGNYFRIGAEYIFTLAPFRQLNLGAMYASSTFSDFGSVQIYSELWPDVEEEFARENFSANWAELILNTQGPIINAESGFFTNLYWGVRFRLRIMISNLDTTDFDIYAVPGYGKTYSQVLPAANLFLKYRFKF